MWRGELGIIFQKMIKLATWNIWGLNQATKHTEVKKLIVEHILDLLYIVETKVYQRNVEKIKRVYIPNWGLFIILLRKERGESRFHGTPCVLMVS